MMGRWMCSSSDFDSLVDLVRDLAAINVETHNQYATTINSIIDKVTFLEEKVKELERINARNSVYGGPTQSAN